MHQPEKLYPILSVMSLCRDLFDLQVAKKKLLETCHIPLSEIGNYNVKVEDQVFVVKESDEKDFGEIELECKTFFIQKVLADPNYVSPVMLQQSEIQYLNNPVRFVEYVTENSMVDWENIFDSSGKFVGTVRAGKFYDNTGQEVGNLEAQKLKEEKEKCGLIFTLPIPYQIKNCKIQLNKKFVGHKVRMKWEYLIDDENGLPLVDENTRTAIAFYMNYLRQMTLYFQGQAPKQVMDKAEELYQQKATFARTSASLNENMRAQITNMLMNFNNQMYNADLDDESFQ